MTAAPIRVLVVEDSATVRACLRAALTADPALLVAAEAVDGRSAVELCERVRPDVITMDVVLPGMDGLAATREIMARVPTPILVVSSGERGEAFTTYDALAAGAVEVLDKPRGDSSDEGWGQRLCAAVKLVARIRVVTRHRSSRGTPTSPAAPAAAGRWADRQAAIGVVAVGASTGGPGAVVQLLRALPDSVTVPVLLVQHMPSSEPLAVAYTDWLGGQIRRPVAYALDGEPVASLTGRVAVGPPGRHLLVRDGRLRLSWAPERHSCRPSVDTLFESAAAEYGPYAAGCLLTGMGRDGAAGLLALRRAGCHTFAQDEESCVVYGMPGAAVLLGAARYVLPPAQIAWRLAGLLAGVHGGDRWRP